MDTVKKKRRKKRDNTSGYFRAILEQQPDLLNSKSNEVLINQWIHDHPIHTQKELKKVKQRLANLKSLMRRSERDGGSTISRGNSMSHPFFEETSPLELLEQSIDECLITAYNLDKEGLDEVIKHLRSARNKVVWKLGM